jgi:hypothetical protein
MLTAKYVKIIYKIRRAYFNYSVKATLINSINCQNLVFQDWVQRMIVKTISFMTRSHLMKFKIKAHGPLWVCSKCLEILVVSNKFSLWYLLFWCRASMRCASMYLSSTSFTIQRQKILPSVVSIKTS